MPTYLIAQSDWADYVPLPDSITSTIYSKEIAPKVNEAQEMDLRALLYKDFYDEVIEVAGSGVDSTNGNLTKVNYDLLLPYLKPIVVYYSYSRWVGRSKVVNSRYGPVQKIDEHSEPLNEDAIKRLQIEEKSKALHYVTVLNEYLEDNTSKYSTWNKNKGKTDSNRTSVRTWST